MNSYGNFIVLYNSLLRALAGCGGKRSSPWYTDAAFKSDISGALSTLWALR